MSDVPQRSNDEANARPRRKLTQEEIKERLNDETLSVADRTAGIFYGPDRQPLTCEDEKHFFEIAVVNDVLESDARSGIERQGILL